MQAAPPGGVLADQSVRKVAADRFVWEPMPPLKVKGKNRAINAFRLIDEAVRDTRGLRQPDYALPMIGRIDELALITSKLDQAMLGRGQVVGITAEAGMGKSRLVAEVIGDARLRDLTGYGGECQSYGINATYLVWQSVFRGFFGLEADATFEEQTAGIEAQLLRINPLLMERMPLLGVLLNLPIPDNDLTSSFDPALRKASLEALHIECLRERSREKPILIVLEDTQWFDPLSLELFRVVTRALPDLAVMVLAAYRTIESVLVERVSRVSALPHFTEVVLNDMPDADLVLLVRAKLRQLYGEDATADSELIEQLSARSQGNPFYVEELLNFLDDRGLDLRKRNALANIALPDSLYSLILGRIDHLTEDQKTALKVASVIGRMFEVATLTGVYPPFAEREALGEDLAILAELELTVLEAPDPELAYLFKHVLTQEVAYETLSFATRAMLHGQIAQFVESSNVDALDRQLDLLAHHYDRSENLSKRREYLRKAGEAAQTAGANTSARSYYERVLALLIGRDRLEVLMRLGQVLELEGDWTAAETRFSDALEEAGRLLVPGDRHEASGRAEHALGVLNRKRGEYVAARVILARSQTSFDAAANFGGSSRVAAELGELNRLQGRYTEALALYEESFRLAEGIVDETDRSIARAHALKGAGVVAYWQGDYETGLRYYDESLAIRREISDKQGVAVLLNNQAVIARHRQDLDSARRLNDESILLLREVGDRWAVGQLLNNQACVASDQGDYEQARVLLNESLSIRRQLGDRAGLALSLNTLADVVIDEGDFLSAGPLLDEALGISRELDDRTAIAYLIEDYAGVAAALGRPERALRLGGFAAALRGLIGAPLPPTEQQRVERMLAPARARLDPITTERAWSIGAGHAETLDLDVLLNS